MAGMSFWSMSRRVAVLARTSAVPPELKAWLPCVWSGWKWLLTTKRMGRLVTLRTSARSASPAPGVAWVSKTRTPDSRTTKPALPTASPSGSAMRAYTPSARRTTSAPGEAGADCKRSHQGPRTERTRFLPYFIARLGVLRVRSGSRAGAGFRRASSGARGGCGPGSL